MAGVPYIVNITGLGTAVENPGLLQKITVAMYKVAMKKAACIFFQNKGNEQFFASKDIRNDVHRIIPGSGVNLDKFTYQEYPEEDQPLRFVFISRIMREKGIEEYFAAAKHFKTLHPEMVFHVLGACEEEYEQTLAELQKNGTIIYHGQQKDVRPFIIQANCTIHPTFYPEGMSNVVLESAATGRPVITTRRHGCMEAIEDGVTGFLFEERNTSQLISCIDKFLAMTHQERVAMGKAAHEKMEREFNRQIVVNAYLDEIKKL
jgi:galacturonosyltransferase